MNSIPAFTTHPTPTVLPLNQDNDVSQPQVFTEPEAAKFLRLSRQTLQRIRLRGEIAFCRVGGTRVVYTRQHLDAYLASRERAAYHQ